MHGDGDDHTLGIPKGHDGRSGALTGPNNQGTPELPEQTPKNSGTGSHGAKNDAPLMGPNRLFENFPQLVDESIGNRLPKVDPPSLLCIDTLSGKPTS